MRPDGQRFTHRRPLPIPEESDQVGKLEALGMSFGGQPLLERTVGEIVSALGFAKAGRETAVRSARIAEDGENLPETFAEVR